MKRALFASLALLFLCVFLTPGQAQAHAGETHGSMQSTAQTNNDTVVSKDTTSKTQEVSATTDKETKRNCNGSCCGTAGCCVSAALSTAVDFGIPFSKGSLMEISNYETLPPGPGYPLLRPPRIFA